ncbi:hypothetical protein ACLVWQ_32005 (plasmid) [Streptomyces sp. CWNU-52B]|uniref:hypothetical protein n=1 Tax=unclassified Streptomyces TaxID=2593676 RepID=UPI0039C0F66D
MSHQPMAPVAQPLPVPASAVSPAVMPVGEGGEYGATAERMEELVKSIPGYLGTDHAGSPGGLSVTVRNQEVGRRDG